jgi:hypothetical protein
MRPSQLSAALPDPLLKTSPSLSQRHLAWSKRGLNRRLGPAKTPGGWFRTKLLPCNRWQSAEPLATSLILRIHLAQSSIVCTSRTLCGRASWPSSPNYALSVFVAHGTVAGHLSRPGGSI